MSKIIPQYSYSQLSSKLGKSLPGVKSDAKDMDPKAYKTNRKLAKKIDQAVDTLKPKDANGEYFILSWRLYPNKSHPIWKQRKGSHFCGCGCGCRTIPNPPKKKARARKVKAKLKAG